jgi:hypothetical protein
LPSSPAIFRYDNDLFPSEKAMAARRFSKTLFVNGAEKSGKAKSGMKTGCLLSAPVSFHPFTGEA